MKANQYAKTMKKLLILNLFLACTIAVLTAQETPPATPDSLQITADTVQIADDAPMIASEPVNDYTIDDKPSMNFIKLSLTSLPLLNFSLQYERVFSKSISGAVSFSFMPERNIPYVEQIIEMADFEEPEAEDVLRNMLVSSYTATPEIRFYLGKKGYGTGFYLSLFYRYGHYEVSNAEIPYTNDNDEDITINTAGTLTSHSGGFLMGYQWAIGKHMCIDWQMFGPHYGVSSGDFLGLPTEPLNAADQENIEEEFMNIDSPLFDQTVDASADEVKMMIDGPWAGVRFSLSFGVKF